MKKTIEQHAVIRVCWKAGFNEMIQEVYDESAVHRTTLFR